MQEKLETIIRALVAEKGRGGPLTGIDIAGQFRPQEQAPGSISRNLNAAFLISLCGAGQPGYAEAREFMETLRREGQGGNGAGFFHKGLSLIYREIRRVCRTNKAFRRALEELCGLMGNASPLPGRQEALKGVWQVFFPEGLSLKGTREEAVAALREKRRVRITRLNPWPIQEPGKEVLFTSNVLLTPPAFPGSPLDPLLPRDLKGRLKDVAEEPQHYWYDHPIEMGTQSRENELLYGLKALDRAVAFEIERGIVRPGSRVTCVLSLSVTHAGLRDLAKPYVHDLLRRHKGFSHLRIFALSEADTSRLVKDLLAPAAKKYMGVEEERLLHSIIGVDGEYGRHYSLLKAVSAFWHVFLDPSVRATFKIDLDQVFPQRELVRETGLSALEHLKSPLWGAQGVDQKGELVDLGMIAGALVNQKDIGRSLFTPDVPFPSGEIEGDEWVFFSPLTQALSTEAEMMTRYRSGPLNGRNHCIQRVHVTGGTCGILVDSLRQHRPFTPTLIGRAEDQAYMLSTLFEAQGPYLRYLHKDGLIMRHDKDSLATQAIKRASTGKLVGDYARILLFSYYAAGLPWPVDKIKDVIDPFTGCFVSPIPVTVAYLRLALKGASLFKAQRGEEGDELVKTGAARLGGILQGLLDGPETVEETFWKERRGWDLFHDLLDRVEEALKRGDSWALSLKERAGALMEACQVG